MSLIPAEFEEGNGIAESVSISGGASVTYKSQLNYLYQQLGRFITTNDLSKVYLRLASAYYALAGVGSGVLSFYGVVIGTSNKTASMTYVRLKSTDSSMIRVSVDTTKTSLSTALTFTDLTDDYNSNEAELILFK